MRYKIFVWVLVIEAVICVVLRTLQASFAGAFSAMMAFPFEQIGLGLRTLSLSGSVGNVSAIVIYCLIGLLPIAALFALRKRRKLYVEDGLLVLLSAALFAVIYFMINPGAIMVLVGGITGQSIGKAILGGTVYSVLCGYFVLRVLRLFSAGSMDKLFRYMLVMLSLMSVIFVYLVFGACFDDFLNSITALQSGNVGNEHLLGTSYVCLVMQFFVNALPYVLDIWIVFTALRLLQEMKIDRYSVETVTAAERMSRLCSVTLAATVLSNIIFNLLQLLLVKSIVIVNVSVQIPVLSIAFALVALLLTRLVIENKRLKDDNDMFV